MRALGRNLLSPLGQKPGFLCEAGGGGELLHRDLHRQGGSEGELRLDMGGRAPQRQPHPLRDLAIVPWAAVISPWGNYFSFFRQ